MEEADLERTVAARKGLEALLTTLAPENASNAQIARLAAAGVTVSLGHSDSGYATATAAVEAGAHVVTHLFNAMSQLGNREPGMVGATLDLGHVSAGLIADGFHVHPAAIRTALRAKRGPGRIFLVTDAMSPMGTDMTSFFLNGREIFRESGRSPTARSPAPTSIWPPACATCATRSASSWRKRCAWPRSIPPRRSA